MATGSWTGTSPRGIYKPAMNEKEGSITSGAWYDFDTSLTNIHNKLWRDNAINVKSDYSAVGDGVTDDSMAFSNAITAAGVNGMIFVPYTADGYSLESGLTFLSKQRFFGLGKPKLLFNTSDTAIVGPARGSIENFIINNNGGSGNGVQIKSRTWARNLEIEGFNTDTKYGLQVAANEYQARMESVEILDCHIGLDIPSASNANYGHGIDIRVCDERATSTGLRIASKSNWIHAVCQSNSIGIKLLSGATQNLIFFYKENDVTNGEFDSGANGNLIIDFGPGSDYGDYTDNGNDNIVWSAKHGAGFEWIFNKVLAERFELEDRSKNGALAILHNANDQFYLTINGSTAEEFRFVHYQSGVGARILNVTADGYFQTDDKYKIKGANSQYLEIKQKTTELTDLEGATETWTNAIPAGTQVFGVTARVTTAVEGCTSIDIGDGTDADIFIDGMAVAVNTTADLANCNDGTLLPTTYKSATNIVLTALGNGASFSAGAVRLTLYYIDLTAPTS